jgi:hypothetical protein
MFATDVAYRARVRAAGRANPCSGADDLGLQDKGRSADYLQGLIPNHTGGCEQWL